MWHVPLIWTGNQMKKFLLSAVALVTLAAGVISPAAAEEKEYVVVEAALPFDPLEGAEAFWGIQNGAGWQYEVPEHWNGDLVMWAHGYAGTGTDLFVQQPPQGLREYLIANGYAWGASSYSENDYRVATPAKETRRLAQSFKKFTGVKKQPAHRYLLGVSMGGNITAYSAERYRKFYDGLLPACGVLADKDLFDYFADANLAFQELGGNGELPVANPAQWLGVDVPANKAALEAAPGSWPFALNDDGEALKQLIELESGGDRPNFDEGWTFWNIAVEGQFDNSNFLWSLAIDTGTVPLEGQFNGNDGEVYQLDLDPALSAEEVAFNENIQRVERMSYLPYQRKELPENKGRFVDPMLTIHNLGDLFVPFNNEVEYYERVQANGFPNKLVQRAIRGAGHCDFTTAEWITSFQDLENWAENGVKPEGDIVNDPAAVADPSYGCRFTEGDHFFAAPCGMSSDR